MSPPGDPCVRALAAALDGSVMVPDDGGYRAALDRVFFTDAARRRPSCVVTPKSSAQVGTVLRIVAEHGSRMTVRGGGLSSLCTADDAVMIDLSAHFNTVTTVGDRARVGGGSTMGALLAQLVALGRVVPVGLFGLPGLGLATRGGIGYLTRSMGLTLDHLDEVELVVPGGETLRLSAAGTGPEADLWWAVRGCAPHFGVVTSATFRSQPLGPIFAQRAVFELDALAAYFALAPTLPPEISLSAVLSRPPLDSSTRPLLLTYTVYAGDDGAGIATATDALAELTRAAGSRPLVERADTYRYPDLPAMAVLGPDGAEPANPPPPVPGEPRTFLYGKAPFLRAPLDGATADLFIDRIRAAPTPLCRIDFQHTGGELGAVANDATAFWGRDAEWSVPLNAIWTESLGDRESCVNWARETVAALAGVTSGYYSVEVRPGFPESQHEVAAAYGDNLSRLRALKRVWDPDGLMGVYPL